MLTDKQYTSYEKGEANKNNNTISNANNINFETEYNGFITMSDSKDFYKFNIYNELQTSIENVVETYEGPNHDRNEYNEIAFKLMSNAGIKVVEEF